MIEGKDDAARRRLRLGMVGGGEGAFIGAVHRIASRIDDRYVFVAGALASTPDKARRSGMALWLDSARSYPDFATMAEAEAARPDGIDAVAIVTPNDVHVPASLAFLEAGIHVICDKPLATSLAQARTLEAAVAKAGKVFALTHNYTAYPLIRQAREMVRAGDLGPLRLVQVEYAQDWLSEPLEATGQKQALWRADPARNGLGGALGDIGTHAFNLARFVTGLTLDSLCADLTRVVPGRRLDDNVAMLLRWSGGARGMLWASQVAPGHENGLRLRLYGPKGGLDWGQENPNRMIFSPLGAEPRILTRNGPGASAGNRAVSRVPPGHPEGYLEGFATLYTEIADAIEAADRGEDWAATALFPTARDGVEGMAFMEAAVASSQADGAWTRLAD